ncbi:low molecular weight protein-tyrosine-phosphatase [Saccharicrinis sp. FJH54]|uniref:low molecular weight protein-tyrosine-phosphatase n=1 Tax=Saccharicrinis sp. FJH54 TaxID=3344665 RepID=UPI0035D4FA51
MNILFVCLGNICRSPSAEAVFKNIIQKERLDQHFFVDSAGTMAYHAGETADARMQGHAIKRGYNLTSISRRIEQEDFKTFDLIVAMDNTNYNDLMRIAPDREAELKIVKMTDFSREYNYTEVPDPYYGGAGGFELVLDLLEDSCTGLLEYVQKEKLITE